MRVIYIAGKYRDARGEYYVRENIRLAEKAALYVWQHGGVAICPHKNTEGFGGVELDKVWLQGDLEIISRCDAVYALSNHVDSEGAKAEIKFAESIDKPILYSLDQVLCYLMIDTLIQLDKG